ncbi:E3 SUMO-protein ligase PIAS, putative (PIAS) [Plasmodium malariae]|uniref:E3 SUMO-protein ligase PIAS, putative (PIAS) n=1 Tax=Plasmodium malariae TaxID=5858 RepID=A0A1A8W547_PLAMA|nr:E3 SUMO-protein ligase PIAS, putative (PIAS) [Plasmodium malariae]
MADCLNKLRVYDLNQLCRKFLLPQHGKKVAIVERILEYITDVEREEQIYEFILATKPSIFDLISGRRINNPLNNNIISNSHSNNNKYFSNNNNFFLSNNNNHANNLFLCNNNDSVNHSNSENSVIKKNNLPVERKGKAVKIYQEDSDFSSCVCGGMNKNVISKNCIVKCIECNKLQHVSCYTQNACVNKDLNNYKILCVVCRLRDIDPFYPLKKVLWMKNLNVNSEKLVINACDIKSWRNENKEVIIFCMHIDKKNLSTNVNLKQEWPRTFILKVNGNVIEKIFEPSWEHKRRDSPLKITHTLKAGNNNIDINITNYEIPKLYVVAFLLCNIETEQSIIENVIVNSSLNFKDSKQRIINILLTKHDDDEVMCMEINRKISLHCPFSLDRILIPCRGVKCCHIQCFDLKSFIDVTKKTKAFNNRWKCPVCSLFLRPKDLVIDTFITYILSQVPKDIKEVELSKSGEIIFNHNSVEGKVIKQVDDIDSVNLQKSKIEIKTEYNTARNSIESVGDKDNIFSPNEIIILDSDPEDNNNCSSFEKSSVQKNHNVTQGEQEVIYISDSDNEDSLPQTTHNIDKKGNEENSPFLFGMNNYSTNKSVNNFLMRNIKGLDKRNFLPNSRIFFNHMVLDVLNDISKIHVNEKLSTVNMQKERTPDPNNNTNTNNNNSGSNHSGNNHSSSSDINTRSNTNINSNINHNNNNDYNYNNSSNNSNSNNNNNNSNNINSNSNNINSNSNNINSNSNNINSNSNSNNINSNSNNINSNSNNNEISSAPPLGFYNKRSILAKDIYLLSSQNALSLKTNNEYISNRDSVEDNNLFYLNNVKNGKICCTPTPQGKDNIISINNNLVAVSNTLLSLNKDISCNNSIASSRKYSNGNRNYNRISASNDNIIGGSMDNIIGGSMGNIIGGSMGNNGKSKEHLSLLDIKKMSEALFSENESNNRACSSEEQNFIINDKSCIGENKSNFYLKIEGRSIFDKDKLPNNEITSLNNFESYKYLDSDLRDILVDENKQNKKKKKRKKKERRSNTMEKIRKYDSFSSNFNFSMINFKSKYSRCKQLKDSNNNNSNKNSSSSSSNNNNNNSSKNNSTSNNNDNNNSSRNRSNSKNSNKCKSCSSTNIKNKIYHVMNRSRYTKKTNSKNDSLNGKKSKKKKKNKK